MSEWDKLSPARQAAIAAHSRRHHSSAARETALRIEDARAEALGHAVDWLRMKGHTWAADALEAECFHPVAPAPPITPPPATNRPEAL